MPDRKEALPSASPQATLKLLLATINAGPADRISQEYLQRMDVPQHKAAAKLARFLEFVESTSRALSDETLVARQDPQRFRAFLAEKLVEGGVRAGADREEMGKLLSETKASSDDIRRRLLALAPIKQIKNPTSISNTVRCLTQLIEIIKANACDAPSLRRRLGNKPNKRDPRAMPRQTSAYPNSDHEGTQNRTTIVVANEYVIGYRGAVPIRVNVTFDRVLNGKHLERLGALLLEEGKRLKRMEGSSRHDNLGKHHFDDAVPRSQASSQTTPLSELLDRAGSLASVEGGSSAQGRPRGESDICSAAEPAEPCCPIPHCQAPVESPAVP